MNFQVIVLPKYFLTIAILLLPCSPAFALQIQLFGSKDITATEVVVALVPDNKDYNFQLNTTQQDISQQNYQFVPRVTVVQKGQSVVFPNRDTTHHNVYSFSKTKRFDFRLYTGQGESTLLNKEGVVTVGCNIHDWMLAYIVVVDTPFFTLSDAKGFIDFKEIPPGKYTVQVWHPGLQADKGLKAVGTLDTTKLQPGQVLKIKIPEGAKHVWPRKPNYINKTY